MTGVRQWSIFFVWKENSRGDSDEYHRFLQFLILDLHKSEVGPSLLLFFFPFFFFFFFFKNEICIKKLKEKMLISGGMSSTLQKTGYNCAAINVTVSPVSWFSLDVVLVS